MLVNRAEPVASGSAPVLVIVVVKGSALHQCGMSAE